MLAGMIQSPSVYDPVEHEPDATDRRNFVLARMVEEGYLLPERAAAFADKPVRADPFEVGLNFPAKTGYFLDYVRRELIDEYDEATVFGGGLQVRTTLDSEMQRYAEEAVANRLNDPGGPEAALVAIDPRDGAVRAMYGGENFRVSGEPRDRRRRIGPAGRVGVQGVHARRRDGAGLRPQRALERAVADHDRGPRVLHERTAVGALERERLGERDLHAALGDEPLGEHGLRAGRLRGDARGDRGRRPSDGDRVRPPARVLDHARDAVRQPARDDDRVRDARRARWRHRRPRSNGWRRRTARRTWRSTSAGSRCSTRTTPTSSPTRSRP